MVVSISASLSCEIRHNGPGYADVAADFKSAGEHVSAPTHLGPVGNSSNSTRPIVA
jgi:hypothetical protein